MNAEDIVKASDMYGITAADLQIAAASEISLLGSMKTGQSLKSVADQVVRLFGADQVTSVLRWATWVANARKNNLPGKNVDELLKVRQGATKVGA